MCGSRRVSQIRTSRREVELPINGARIRFIRLSLERCDECGQITMYDKTCLGSFTKTYIPAATAAEGG